MKNLLLAAQGKENARTPLWLMRQAGRYLPEYMEIRAQHNTLKMFKTPSIAKEITLQPLRRFDLDGAILYADILLIPDALDLGLTFQVGEGPKFSKTVRSAADLEEVLKAAAQEDKIISKLDYVGETLELVKSDLTKFHPNATLLGFAGAPFTVASYMIEGGSAHGEFWETKKLMLNDPATMHGLLDLVTRLTISYLQMQVKAGAEVVQLFESWGGALSPNLYKEFCLPYSKRILAALVGVVPTIHYVGESAGILKESFSAGGDVFSVDWRQSLSNVVPLAQDAGRALQGNLDPAFLFAPVEKLKVEVESILSVGRPHKSGYIFNLGHGINRFTPVESVSALVEIVHKN